jgi:hypothetical protein
MTENRVKFEFITMATTATAMVTVVLVVATQRWQYTHNNQLKAALETGCHPSWSSL